MFLDYKIKYETYIKRYPFDIGYTVDPKLLEFKGCYLLPN